jgi:hypothetical protein
VEGSQFKINLLFFIYLVLVLSELGIVSTLRNMCPIMSFSLIES